MPRIGFVGTGKFARQHAGILSGMGADIVACFGTNLEKTTAFSKEFQCKIHDNPLMLINQANIDALYIVIPPFAHDGQVELAAINKGIPFLCEKPVGLDLTTCKLVSDQIRIKNMITSSGYQLRYAPIFSKIKTLVNNNRISSVRICSYSYMPKTHWWYKKKLSGGMMVESGSHYLDLLRYLFGEVDSVAAFVTEGVLKNRISGCDIYDSMEAVLKLQSGLIAGIGISHLLDKIDGRNDMLEIYGHDFVLKMDLYKLRCQNEAVAWYKTPDSMDWQCIRNETSKNGLLSMETSAFLNAIQKNDHTLIKSSYPDAIESLALALAMNESAESGNAISLKIQKYP